MAAIDHGLAVTNANSKASGYNASYLVIPKIMLPVNNQSLDVASELARACRCLKPTKDKTAAKEST